MSPPSASSSARSRQVLPRSCRALLIDLDDTLYRCEDIPHRVRAAIQAYMVARLGYTSHEVTSATTTLYLQHGTTMAGLRAKGHEVDYDAWHQAVHHEAIDYAGLLHPDLQLRDLLNAIPLPKYILTNADRKHAHICLERLGLTDCFKGIFDFEWAQEAAQAQDLLTAEHPVMCKPQHTVYSLALQAIHCEPSQCIFMDDSARNIQAAHEIGLVTAVVGRDTPVPGADYVLPTMHALPSVLPELFSPRTHPDAGQPHARAHALAQQVEQVVEHVADGAEVPPTQLVAVAQGSGAR